MELLEPFRVRAKEGNGAEVGSATKSVSGGVAGSCGMFQGEVEFCEEGLPAGLSSGEVLFGEEVVGGDFVREYGEWLVEEVMVPSAQAVYHGGEFFFVGGVVTFGGAPFLTFV